MTKLDDQKIHFICRHVVDQKDWMTRELADKYKVTQRRIQQVVKKYRDTREFPALNPMRRPKGPPLTNEEMEIIDQIWSEKRVGARLLYKELLRRGYRIPHNRIHRYLIKTGRTVPNPNKQKERKRCRYEREHSFSLVHGDWHRITENHPHAIVWLDDASRFAICGGEFPEATMQHSIETFQIVEKVAQELNTTISQVNTDRGTEFYSNHPESTSIFQDYLAQRGIEHIPSRRKNPQTNGKLERFWYEYDKHRSRFAAIEDFLSWYNNRLHGALWVDIAETPLEAVFRKLQPEALLGLFLRWAQ